MRQPSCVAFGGDKPRMLFVTSATQDLSEEILASEPDSGRLFIFETQSVGVAVSRFRV